MDIGINGILGRMGRQVYAVLGRDRSLRLTLALESEGHPDLGKDAGMLLGGAPLDVPLASAWTGRCDVLIDFTVPQASLLRLEEAVAHQSALVIGTTGFSPEQQQAIQKASASIPILLAPNFSFGVNFLLTLVERMAAMLGDDFDIEILESHHRNKLDAPSGTAKAIAKAIAKGAGRDLDAVAIYGREGQIGVRPKEQIGIHTIRAGGIVGDHTAVFGSEEEVIEISHRALSRAVFAAGAVKAARFLHGKKAGFYSMSDLFKKDRD